MNDSTNIIPFNFDGHPIRAMVNDGLLWLHASDICAALDITDSSQAVEGIPEKHKCVFNTGNPGRPPWFVTKPGAYRLILRSRKPEAERFQDWLTDEVIPTIESTGGYGLPEAVRNYFDRMTARLYEADKLLEHKTRHSFHRHGSPRAVEHRAQALRDVSARYGLDPVLVAHANRTGATDAMAEIVGDPRAIEDRKRVREAVAAIEAQRAPVALPSPRRRSRKGGQR